MANAGNLTQDRKDAADALRRIAKSLGIPVAEFLVEDSEGRLLMDATEILDLLSRIESSDARRRCVEFVREEAAKEATARATRAPIIRP